MNVDIHLYSQSAPVTVADAINAYQKGDMYCVLTKGRVYKFPLVHIFRITETDE